jgi:hypothetical protein
MRGRSNNGGSGSSNNNNNNNNNRRGPNPLTRNYESNGPDVKIRGSAQQIAEKYATLARDAQSAGDRVMAENYLQHAEHYNRIIAAAQAQMPIQQAQNNRDDSDDDGDQDRDDFEVVNGAPGHGNTQNGDRDHQPQMQEAATSQPVDNGSGPQPVIDGTPAEVALKAETPAAATPPRSRGRRAAPRPVVEEKDAPAPVEAATQAVEAVAEEKAEELKEETAAAPRRSRRPRRGERRSDEASAGGEDAAAKEASAEAPAGDAPATDATLVVASN